MLEVLSKWWCRFAHRESFRPVRGRYRCAVCLREWPVPWENASVPAITPNCAESALGSKPDLVRASS
jgi:hypothetical protein